MTSSANHFQQFKNCKVVVFLVYILIREKNIWFWLQQRCASFCFFLFPSLIGSHVYLPGLDLYFKNLKSLFWPLLCESLLPACLWYATVICCRMVNQHTKLTHRIEADTFKSRARPFCTRMHQPKMQHEETSQLYHLFGDQKPSDTSPHLPVQKHFLTQIQVLALQMSVWTSRCQDYQRLFISESSLYDKQTPSL